MSHPHARSSLTVLGRALLGFALGTTTAAAAETVGAKINAQGVTEIFGNHFGMPGVNATYDYVIVGGGNAGNTLAARLALDGANYTVAVIEAGTFYEICPLRGLQLPRGSSRLLLAGGY